MQRIAGRARHATRTGRAKRQNRPDPQALPAVGGQCLRDPAHWQWRRGGVVDRAGRPAPRFHDLNEDQQAALLERYRQRQETLGLLADELVTRGQPEQAAGLRTLIGAPDLNNLYSINGDPVVVRWGLQAQPAVATRRLRP